MPYESHDPLRVISAELDVPGSEEGLLEYVDLLRLDAARKLRPDGRVSLGQYLTPTTTARHMASLLQARPSSVGLLDAGSGAGTLSAAFVAAACAWETKPASITVLAYEIDPLLAAYSRRALERCGDACARAGIGFSGQVLQEDFLVAAATQVQGGLFAPDPVAFECALLNPPYGRIAASHPSRALLQEVGVDTVSRYAAFVWLALRLLRPLGELVALIPRSFCNGTSFRSFRAAFLESMALQQVHLFGARDSVFQEDGVVQETLIVSALKQAPPPERVHILSSNTAVIAQDLQYYHAPYRDLVLPADGDKVIRIVPDGCEQRLAQRMRSFPVSLDELGVGVSTGRVLDYRARDYLSAHSSRETVPLIRSAHLVQGQLRWPLPSIAAAQAVCLRPETRALLIPAGYYVLVKRLTSKEEPRRIRAALLEPGLLQAAPLVGIENHLNYLHCKGAGLPPRLAKGLVAYLNSAEVDRYFRQQSGHTQVNASDLRTLPCPSREQLEVLGERCGEVSPGDDVLFALA